MREDYSTASPERVFYDLETLEEQDSLYENIAPPQPLEDDEHIAEKSHKD